MITEPTRVMFLFGGVFLLFITTHFVAYKIRRMKLTGIHKINLNSGGTGCHAVTWESESLLLLLRRMNASSVGRCCKFHTSAHLSDSSKIVAASCQREACPALELKDNSTSPC